MTSDRTSMLIGLFFVAVLLFNFPLLSIFGERSTSAGFPMLYIYFFLVWGVLIALIYFWLEKKKKNKRK
ncbi:MAG: hypothetical protein AAFV95_06600 [Bacteroidota bacterium]